jgi:hypothetical protein
MPPFYGSGTSTKTKNELGQGQVPGKSANSQNYFVKMLRRNMVNSKKPAARRRYAGELVNPRIRRKVSDEFTVPLCRGHHREVHRYGDEAAWRKVGVDPTVTARALWLETRPRTAGRRHHLTT